MYIEKVNGKYFLRYEKVKCWVCEGTGKVERGISCPKWNQPTNRKPCKHCGGIGKRNHKQLGTKIVDCWHCENGIYQEDRFDFVNESFLKQYVQLVNFHFKGNKKEEYTDGKLDIEFALKCYVGHNSFAGYQDYRDHRNDSESDLLNLIIKDGIKRRLQALNYCDKETGELNLDIVFLGYHGGIEANWINTK